MFQRLGFRCERWISKYVVTIQPDPSMQRKLQEDCRDADSRETFTRIHLDRGQVGSSTPVGDPKT